MDDETQPPSSDEEQQSGNEESSDEDELSGGDDKSSDESNEDSSDGDESDEDMDIMEQRPKRSKTKKRKRGGNVRRSCNVRRRDPRGVTVCKELRSLRERGIVPIQFNKWNNPIAPNKGMYSSYLGTIVRQTIPLNCKSWPWVPDNLKETLWLKLTAMFDVPMDLKWSVLRHGSALWRGWKSTLNQDYIQPRRLSNPERMRDIPPRLTKTVTQQQWNEFVDRVTTKKAIDYSDKQREKKQNQKYKPNTGRGGMTTAYEQCIAEGILNPQRHDVWMRARMNKKGRPANKKLIPVFNQIKKLKEEQAAGTLVLGPDEDILSRAVGMCNLPGYLVGAGLNATRGMLFPPKKLGAQNAEIIRLTNLLEANNISSQQQSYDPTKSVSDVEEELKASQQKVASLSKKLETMKGNDDAYIPQFEKAEDPFLNHQVAEPNMSQILTDVRILRKQFPLSNFFEESIYGEAIQKDLTGPFVVKQKSSDGNDISAYEGFKNKQAADGERLCRLNVNTDGRLRLVAMGRIAADGANSSELVHFRKLKPDEYKVIITLDVESDVEIPIPTEDIKTVQQARDIYVAWPKELVTFDLDLDEPIRKYHARNNRKLAEKNKEVQVRKSTEKAKSKASSQQLSESKATNDNLPIKRPKTAPVSINWEDHGEMSWNEKLRMWANVNGQIAAMVVIFPNEIFGNVDSRFHILTESILQYLNWEWIEATFIAAYMWILHEKIERLGYSDYYGFANPMAVAQSKHCQSVEVRAQKLADNLANRYAEDKLYLVPFLHSDHWMLILINPSANTAQWCNSFGGGPRRQAVDLTERALMEFHQRRGTVWDKKTLTWSVVKVPSQPGGTECALCVMRYMSLVVSSGKRVFNEKLENKQVYKREHFSALKEEWAELFIDKILPMWAEHN